MMATMYTASRLPARRNPETLKIYSETIPLFTPVVASKSQCRRARVPRFHERGLHARLLSSNLGEQIRDENKSPTYNRALHKRGDLPDLSWYNTYHAYADHLQYWDDLAAAFPSNSKSLIWVPPMKAVGSMLSISGATTARRQQTYYLVALYRPCPRVD